ncbi:MAG: hypothetical protein K8S25_14950 [Alphaproteobacteria bacterium]|nr:hypothetical protein [Alphaproteobacteria bacterium]
MVWPFRKAASTPPNSLPQRLFFNSGEAFLEYQCKFGHTKVRENHAVVALVTDAQKEHGTETPIAVRGDGTQTASLRVASPDGGFRAWASTPSGKGDRLQPGDVVLWVPFTYKKEIGSKTKDSRSGWIGQIRAKLKPEIDTTNPDSQIACRYD